MAEYQAGRGTTALGIIGTVLGGAAVAGGGIGGLLGGNGYYAQSYEGSMACHHDIDTAERMAAKDAEIARLRSEKYADQVREDAKQYGIEVYKELKKDITDLKDRMSDKWTDQMVVNANLSNGMTALKGQVVSTADLVAQITRTAVPQSAICNFGGSGCGCGNNI